MKKWMLGALIVVGAGVMALGQAGEKVRWTVGADTTGITGPVRADGVPDYLRAVNERESRGVTPENNAFVGWLRIVGVEHGILAASVREEVVKLCGAEPLLVKDIHFRTFEQYLTDMKVDGASEEKANNILKAAIRSEWTGETMPELNAYLLDQKDELDALVKVSAQERWWSPMVSVDGSTLVGGQLPGLGVYRSAASALAARAVLRGGQGDFEGFVADAIAVKRMGMLVGQGLTAIERLVGVAVDVMSADAMGTIAGSGKLTEAQCRKLRDALAKLPAPPSVIDSAESIERWTILDTLLQTAAGKLAQVVHANPDSGEDSKHFLTITADDVEWDEVLRSVNRDMDALIGAMKSPTIKTLREKSVALEQALQRRYAGLKAPTDLKRRPGESVKDYTHRIANAAAITIPMAMCKAEELVRRDMMFSAMLDVELAAAEQKAATGKWPEPADLVPARMKQLPRDLYPIEAPGALHFKVSARGLRVYSVGQNGKDDGGMNDGGQKLDDLGLGPQ